MRATGTRRNIIEGDGSFAFFINSDDTITGSVFALIDGASTAGWHTVSSGANSPGGVIHRVPMNQWCKVSFHYDGITQARVFINDKLAGARADYRSGLAAVASTGIVIGNWTLTNQYAFQGEIDRVRVWKRDENKIIHDFDQRPLGPSARDHWDDIWSCMGADLTVDQAQRVKLLGEQWEELLRQLFRTIHQAPLSERMQYLELLNTYSEHWRKNTIDEPAFIDVIGSLHEIILRMVGNKWLDDATNIALALNELTFRCPKNRFLKYLCRIVQKYLLLHRRCPGHKTKTQAFANTKHRLCRFVYSLCACGYLRRLCKKIASCKCCNTAGNRGYRSSRVGRRSRNICQARLRLGRCTQASLTADFRPC